MPYPEDYPVSPRQAAEYMAWLKDMEAARQVKEERGIYALRAPRRTQHYGPEAAEASRDYGIAVLKAVSLGPCEIEEWGVNDDGDGTTPIMAWAEGYAGPVHARVRAIIGTTGRVTVTVEIGPHTMNVSADLPLQPEADHDLVAAIVQAASVYSRQGLPL